MLKGDTPVAVREGHCNPELFAIPRIEALEMFDPRPENCAKMVKSSRFMV